jgi:hypothetical protein
MNRTPQAFTYKVHVEGQQTMPFRRLSMAVASDELPVLRLFRA